MKNEISTTDVFGDTVSCSTSQWNSHIVSGHPIMKNNMDAVVDTINSPEAVYQSNTYDSRKIFFKKSSYSTYDSSRFHTKVVVDYLSQTGGEIVTAFPIQGIKGGIGNVLYNE